MSAPLLDVLASAAIEQPPLEMPAAASANESQNNADAVAEPMPEVSADAQVTEAVPVTSTPVTGDMSLLGADQLTAAPVDNNWATPGPRFLLHSSRLLCTLLISPYIMNFELPSDLICNRISFSMGTMLI